MRTLYELTSDYAELFDMLYDEDVDSQTVVDTMEAIDMEIEDKADAYARIVQQLTYDADSRKKESERLRVEAQVLENKAKRIKDTLQANLEFIGKTKFRTDLFSFSVCNNGGKLPLEVTEPDVFKIPKEFLIYPDPVVNTEAVRSALDKDPGSVAFAHYNPRGRHLRIK